MFDPLENIFVDRKIDFVLRLCSAEPAEAADGLVFLARTLTQRARALNQYRARSRGARSAVRHPGAGREPAQEIHPKPPLTLRHYRL